MQAQPYTREALDLGTAARMLQYVDAHDRDTWVQVGKALAAEFGDLGAELFRDWSARAENFEERACRDTWRSCVRKPGRYTAGTLVALALRGGFKFESVRAPVTPEERAREAALRERVRQAREREAEQREVDAVSAQARARHQWRQASREGASVYAERKGITQPESCRFAANGALLVPMVRPDLPPEHALRGLQSISPDGTKRFTKGMDKVGTCCRLGAVAQVGAPFLLCEGWATGGSIRAALRHLGRPLPVIVCFDAGNLREVSRLLGRMHPSSPQVLCADDDWQTTDKDGRPLNPGRVAAGEALAALLDAGVPAVRCHPVWRGVRQEGWTDFNDLHLSLGVAEVAQQIELALEVLQQLRAARRV
jgi:putative DNA primase/helicase